MAFCNNCGSQVPDGASFCQNCGNRIMVQQQIPIQPSNPVTPPYQPVKRKKSKWWIVLAVFLGICFIGVVSSSISNTDTISQSTENEDSASQSDSALNQSEKSSSVSTTQRPTTTKPKTTAATTVKATAAPVQSYDVYRDLKFSNLTFSTTSSSDRLEGTVTNTGKVTYKFVEVKVRFIDANGTVLDTDSTYAIGSEGLDPGESATFRAYCKMNPQIVNATIEIMED